MVLLSGEGREEEEEEEEEEVSLGVVWSQREKGAGNTAHGRRQGQQSERLGVVAG
jgi:hypothetical protein